MKSSNLLISITLFLIIAVLNGCSSTPQLISNSLEKRITVDGNASDWSNLHYLDDFKVNIGFRNDNEYLYMCLATNEYPKVMQMFRSGFIVWFETNDGKTLGIKYPFFDISRHNNNFRKEGMDRRGNPDEFIKEMINNQDEIQIVNKDKFPLTMLPKGNNEGIKAALGMESGQFVYELKVPLNTNKKFSYEVAAIPGDNLKIKFETEQVNRENIRNSTGRGMGEMQPPEGGENPGGFGGGRRGGGRGRGAGFNRTSVEPLNFDVKIQLQK